MTLSQTLKQTTANGYDIAAGQILGIQVLDHVIIGGAFSDTYYSMKDNGIIE